MKPPTPAEALRAMIESSKSLETGLRGEAVKVLKILEAQQREFQAKKKRVEDDIKRGAKLSKGKIPF